MIKIKKLNHSFIDKRKQKRTLFRDFNLQIADRSVTAILGSSGLGKSTLLKFLAGHIPVKSGKILFNNKSQMPQSAVISQESDLFEWMTVYENLKITTPQPQKILRYLKIVELDKYLHSYPKELSGGMRKRLSIIRAFLSEAKYIIMDEAFAFLDIVTKQKLLSELLKMIKSAQKTVIMVTHDLDEAIYLADKVVILAGKPVKVLETIEIPHFQSTEIWKADSPLFLKLRNQIKSVLFEQT
ncbi:hypothetical protein DRH14_02185 [Candidatus Shapirobacteria bacterium]|nr:MAG: hypothetical protein DRH14_02185 [Candidatus Shapirobacteria bacterium]